MFSMVLASFCFEVFFIRALPNFFSLIQSYVDHSCSIAMTSARPMTMALITFLRPAATSRWTVPREIPIRSPACSWVNPSPSQRRSASNSSWCSGTCSKSDRGMPAGLKTESPGGRCGQAQHLGFFGRGDIRSLSRASTCFRRAPFQFNWSIVIPEHLWSELDVPGG